MAFKIVNINHFFAQFALFNIPKTISLMKIDLIRGKHIFAIIALLCLTLVFHIFE
jgi:hypothetical protein